jgi:hypothetical protein
MNMQNDPTFVSTTTTKKMETKTISKSRLWTGRIMSGLVILFMLFDAIIKLIPPSEEVKVAINQLGYSEHHIVIIGLSALFSILLYTIPRTSVLGAVLLTAHFGGAIATHVRVDNPLFSHTLFPIYIGILMWGGLWLRDQRLQKLLPIKI